MAIDAREYLTSLIGRTIETYKGLPNTVLAVDGDDVIVGTTRSPHGQRVPIKWVQTALDRLEAEGDVEVSVPSLGHRSTFVGAVLASVPRARFVPGSPPAVRLDRS